MRPGRSIAVRLGGDCAPTILQQLQQPQESDTPRPRCSSHSSPVSRGLRPYHALQQP